jgi:MFS transporter, ACS family, hexuronate transporter
LGSKAIVAKWNTGEFALRKIDSVRPRCSARREFGGMIQSSNISPSFRWKIALLVSAAIAISYLDRQALPVALKAVQKDIPISNTQFSHINIAFLVTYGLMYAVGGKFLDMVGTRVGFTICMLFWSIACASHGFATSVTMLVASRLLLGAGEGGGFPAATKAVAEWFAVRERSSAMGIINAGTAVGSIAALPLIALILMFANWRWVFFVTGALGLLWTFAWRIFYFVPKQTSINADIPEVSPNQSSDTPSSATPPWQELLGLRQTWGIVGAKFLSDAAWYFYLFWLPKYLYDARGLDLKTVAAFAWVPYAAAGVGCLCGGGLSSFLTRGYSVNRARKVALGLSAAIMPLILFVPHVSLVWVIVLFSVAYFGQQWWSTLVMVLPTDIFPRQSVGTIAGLVGFGGAMGGVVYQQIVGYLLDHGFGYGLVFSLAGSFHVIAFIVICVVIPIIRPLNLMRAQSPQSPITNYQLP